MHGGPWYILVVTPTPGHTIVYTSALGGAWLDDTEAPPRLFVREGHARSAVANLPPLLFDWYDGPLPKALIEIRPVVVAPVPRRWLETEPPRPSPLARLRAWWAAWSPYI